MIVVAMVMVGSAVEKWSKINEWMKKVSVRDGEKRGGWMDGWRGSGAYKYRRLVGPNW